MVAIGTLIISAVWIIGTAIVVVDVMNDSKYDKSNNKICENNS